jgi:hypothetical protein
VLHRHCAIDECQRERRRLAQKARRAQHGGPAVLSAERKKHRAKYMASYREEHAVYRRRERGAAHRRRVVTEAGSNDEPARLYVASRPGEAIRLRVVTEAGRSIELGAAVTSEILGRVVTEAG